MNKTVKILFFISIFLILVAPTLSLAQEDPLGICNLEGGTTTQYPTTEAVCGSEYNGSWVPISEDNQGAPGATTPSSSNILTPANSSAPTSPSSDSTASSSASSISSSGRLVTCDNNCGWNELLALVNKVIHFILFDMAIPIAAIMFVYAGFELVTSGGSTEKRGVAKNVFTNAVIGLVIAVAAWLIIRTILSILGYNGTWIGF